MSDRYKLYLGENMDNFAALYTAFNNTNLISFLTFTGLRMRFLKPTDLGLGAAAAAVANNPSDSSAATTYYINRASTFYAVSGIEVTAR